MPSVEPQPITVMVVTVEGQHDVHVHTGHAGAEERAAFLAGLETAPVDTSVLFRPMLLRSDIGAWPFALFLAGVLWEAADGVVAEPVGSPMEMIRTAGGWEEIDA